MGPELLLAGLFLALWMSGWLVLFRLPRCRNGNEGPYPRVSVIIPARNEEKNLPRLLRSLREQDLQPDEVLVVDDGSTDRTAEFARREGARVLTSEPLPPGWRGKAWACHQGARAAQGEVLLFLDADTFFLPGGYRRLLDTFLSVGGALSVAPYHEVRRPYEQLSAFFNLLMLAGVGAFSGWARPGQATGLLGPCLVIRAETYVAAGGHESVRGQVLENLYLAEHLARLGIARHCCGGRDTLAFRMYPDGYHSLVEGWRKAFAKGATCTPALSLLLTVLWLSGAAMLGLLLPGGLTGLLPHGGWLAAGYLLFAVQIGLQLQRIGTFSPWTALCYPVPLSFFFVVFSQSLRNRDTRWKGRDLAVD